MGRLRLFSFYQSLKWIKLFHFLILAGLFLSLISGETEARSRKRYRHRGGGTCHRCDRASTSRNLLAAMACNAFHEAWGEGLRGMIEVNRTAIARAKSGRFPKSIHGVIYQYKQFSWTLHSRPICNQKAWNVSVQSALAAYKEGSNQKLFYHANYVKPYWSHNCTGRMRINHHIFYSNCYPSYRRSKYTKGHRSHYRKSGKHRRLRTRR